MDNNEKKNGINRTSHGNVKIRKRSKSPAERKKKKTRALVFGAVGVVAVIAVAIILFSVLSGGNSQDPASDDPKINAPISSEGQNVISNTEEEESHTYCQVNIFDFSSLENLRQKAKQLKSQGFSYAVIDAKEETGKLKFVSETEIAKNSGANSTFEAFTLSEAVALFHEEGLRVCALFNCFRDDVAASSSFEISVLFSENMRWSDGSSRWISVYSEKGRKYVVDTLGELIETGVDEVVLRNYYLPETDTPESIYYNSGEGVDSKTIVKTFLDEVKAAFPATKIGITANVETLINPEDTHNTGVSLELLSNIVDFIAFDFSFDRLPTDVMVGSTYLLSPESTEFEAIEALCRQFADTAFKNVLVLTQCANTKN